MDSLLKHGLILFAHGSRDLRWAEPFERIAARLRTMRGAGQPVTLAFLELMTPSLPEAAAALVTQGCDAVTVVPVFLGQGGHVRRDLPLIIEQCQAAHPGLVIRCTMAAGEDDTVLEAIAGYCLTQLGESGLTPP
jgi:sirohydrochlorin cobaltochelatase